MLALDSFLSCPPGPKITRWLKRLRKKSILINKHVFHTYLMLRETATHSGDYDVIQSVWVLGTYNVAMERRLAPREQ